MGPLEQLLFSRTLLGHQRAHGHPCLLEQVLMAAFPAPLVRPNVLPKKDISFAIASGSHIVWNRWYHQIPVLVHTSCVSPDVSPWFNATPSAKDTIALPHPNPNVPLTYHLRYVDVMWQSLMYEHVHERSVYIPPHPKTAEPHSCGTVKDPSAWTWKIHQLHVAGVIAISIIYTIIYHNPTILQEKHQHEGVLPSTPSDPVLFARLRSTEGEVPTELRDAMIITIQGRGVSWVKQQFSL